MTTAYLRGLTDEGLAEHLTDTLGEQERRSRLARSAEQVAYIAAQFVADGGDKTLLEAALAEVPTEPADG